MSDPQERLDAPPPLLTRLSELAAGQVARLDRRELSEGEACLLAAMGLSEGCRVVMRTTGDPCIVEVRATRIGIARSLASRLLVTCGEEAR
ncbi:MAG: FeoA family protein [Thermoanaerobaculia bacterium]